MTTKELTKELAKLGLEYYVKCSRKNLVTVRFWVEEELEEVQGAIK